MSLIQKLIKPSYLIDMNDIIREGNPILRKVAEEVPSPLSIQDVVLGEKMLDFLKNSQDPITSKKMQLRPGIGLAAPQIAISKRLVAVLIPNPGNSNQENEHSDNTYVLKEIMYNPKIISHSIQNAALKDGEGCLSIDREIPGYVIRHARVTVEYLDKTEQLQQIRLKGLPAIVIQHEIDHINGIMFYERINQQAPWKVPSNLVIIQ